MNLGRFALLAMPMLLLAAQQPASVTPQLTANSEPTKPEDLCSVEGHVFNAITGEALRKVQISMYSEKGGGDVKYGGATDAAGRFEIQSIEAGRYSLIASRNGFVTLQYGARGTRRSGTPLSLSPGQRTRDLVFRLPPHAIISGHVLDEDGETVERVQVSVMRYGFTQGKRQLTPYGSGITDDLGEYRIFGLESGKYYLSARYRQQNMNFEDRTPGGAADEDYAATYFPGTNDPTAAVALDVAAGALLGGIDIALKKTRTVRIRGRVANTMGEGLPRNVSVRLMPKDMALFGFFAGAAAQVHPQNGTFELRGVTPGAYTLIAQWSDEAKYLNVRHAVDVGNRNIENLSLLLSPGIELKGQIRTEKQGDAHLENLYVGLDSKDFLPMGRPGTRVKEDGSFAVENVSADSYTIRLNGLPEGYYMKSVSLGDVDALANPLDLTRGYTGILEILISPSGGQVEGAVQNDNQQPAGGASVVLIPDASRRQQSSLFQITRTDQYGHFSIKGIAPGDYQLFAWEEVELREYEDPEFLRPFEDRGEAVTIREGGHKTAQLKLIPTETAPAQKKAAN
jgi:hypothetical protein